MLVVIVALIVLGGTVVSCMGMWLTARLSKMEQEERLPDYEAAARRLEHMANKIMTRRYLLSIDRDNVKDLLRRADETRARGERRAQQQGE